FLACEPTRSPTTLRGQALFGAMIGGLTVALRVGLGVAGAGYWALLMVNTIVPALGRARRGRAVVGR
ncbi:MAG: RnfABCDGE type electron transport complex subunit D, partial [Phycisphaerae bacterium]